MNPSGIALSCYKKICLNYWNNLSCDNCEIIKIVLLIVPQIFWITTELKNLDQNSHQESDDHWLLMKLEVKDRL